MRRLIFSCKKNDFALVAAGFVVIVTLGIAFGTESSEGPSDASLKNPAIKSSQKVEELGVTVVDFKNGITCVIPYNKRSISCNPTAGMLDLKK